MGWGGARPGSGRKKQPAAKAAVKATPKTAEQARPRVDVNQMIDIIAKSMAKKPRSMTPEMNPFRMPAFPPGVGPKDTKLRLAMDESLNWASQQWAGGQLATMAAQGLIFPGYPYLSELAQRAEYRTMAETISTEMTRKWIKFSGTGESEKRKKASGGKSAEEDGDPGIDDKADNEKTEKIKELVDFLDHLRVRDHYAGIAAQDSFFGRTHLFHEIGNGSDTLASPIGTGRDDATAAKVSKGAGGLKRLQVIEPVWTYPTTYNATNPLSFDWYNPQVWYVMGQEIHISRMPLFVGREVPDLLKPAYSFGGISLTQLAQPYVDIWLTTRESVGQLIHAFSTMVLSTDLATLLQPGGSDVLTRVAMFNALRDNQGTFVINKETEDFKNVAAPLGGLHELQSQSQEHMMSVARIPAVKFTGIQPAGLNASSEGELRAFYDTIGSHQNKLFRPNLTFTIDLAMITLWGERDPDITYDFVPLWELDEKEKAEKRKNDAETGSILIQDGVVSPEEERQRIASDPETLYHGIDPADVPEPPQDPGEIDTGGEGGGEGGVPPVKAKEVGGKSVGGEAADEGIIPFAEDAEFKESDHPRGQPGNAGQFGSGGGSSSSESSESNGSSEEPIFASKKHHAAHLLQNGVTTKEMLAALKWPSISMPAMAKSLGMNLEKVKEGGVTKYKGTPMTAAERAAAGLPSPGQPRRARKNLSLLEHLAASGGISASDPMVNDLRAILGKSNKFIPGFGMLIRPTGVRLDKARESAVEQKYFEKEGQRRDNTTIRTLLDAISNEERGTRLYPAGTELPENTDRESHYHAIETAIHDGLTDCEIDPKTVPDKTMKRIVEIMDKEHETDPLIAYERAVMEQTQDDAPDDRIDDFIPDWDVPDDGGPAPEAGRQAP